MSEMDDNTPVEDAVEVETADTAGAPEAAPASNNIVYALAGIIALLLITVGFLAYKSMNRIPDPVPVSATPGAAAPATFDPSTATKVPAGVAPVDFVKGYYEAIDKGDYADAYKRLPLDKQQSYGDSAAFESQLKGYGISGYEMEAPVEADGSVSVVAWQQTPNGAFGYKWTLVAEGEDWVVQSRVQAGMK